MSQSLTLTPSNAVTSTSASKTAPAEALTLGRYVKIVGLVENTELNGQLGVVIPKRNPLEKDRISVRVFSSIPGNPDRFTKRDVSIRPSHLIAQTPPHHKKHFDVTRRLLAALYVDGPRARRVLNSDSRRAIQAEIIALLEDDEQLMPALERGTQALTKQAELGVIVDSLILCLSQ